MFLDTLCRCKCPLATGGQTYKNHTVSRIYTSASQPFCHTTHSRVHPISCVGGATPPSHNHTHSIPLSPFHYNISVAAKPASLTARIASTLTCCLVPIVHPKSTGPESHTQPEAIKLMWYAHTHNIPANLHIIFCLRFT